MYKNLLNPSKIFLDCLILAGLRRNPILELNYEERPAVSLCMGPCESVIDTYDFASNNLFFLSIYALTTLVKSP